MLYPYRLVSEERLSVEGKYQIDSPASGFLEIVGILCDLFDELPTVLYLPGGTAMTLLFRDVAYQQRDIIDCVGSLAAQVEKQLPLRFYGTTDSRETAELTVQMDEQNSGKAVARVRSVSGRPIGQMSSLGVHLEMPDSQHMEHLEAVVSSMTLNSPMVGVVSRKHEQFVNDCGLLVPTEGSAFTYFSWSPEISPSQCLYALQAEHKIQLWQAFLADRQQPKESGIITILRETISCWNGSLPCGWFWKSSGSRWNGRSAAIGFWIAPARNATLTSQEAAARKRCF